ncbi:MAG: hypothetical protein Q4C34_00645 [Bacteroidales bacterium]|nr:hypothetical protein [Bacteroidales bacterium]
MIATSKDNTDSRRGPRWAQIVSDVFSPLLIPTYGMAMAMWITPLRAVPESSRLIATLIVAAVTALVPLGAIMLLMKLGRVSDTAISNTRERLVPYSIAVVCYCAAAWVVRSIGAPWWLTMFFCGAAFATAVSLVITLVWKISAHSTAVGGLVGMMLWFTVSGLADVHAMIWLSMVIVLAGVVGTARLLLDRHTLAQVLAGLALGIACCFGAMCIY